jgi:hypothetical protein
VCKAVRPQEIAKKVVHFRPAPGPSAVLLDQWNEIGRKLTAMAEDFPEDKYDFKPVTGANSFAERLPAEEVKTAAAR